MPNRPDYNQQTLDDQYDNGYVETPYYDDRRQTMQTPPRTRRTEEDYDMMMQGGYPPANTIQERQGGMPIAAIVFGVLALIVGMTTGLIRFPGIIIASVLAAIALILGIVSIARSGQFNGDGRGKGIAAILLSVFSVLAMLASSFFLPSLLANRATAANSGQAAQEQAQDANENTQIAQGDSQEIAGSESQSQEPVILNDEQAGSAEPGTQSESGNGNVQVDDISISVQPRTTETSPALISIHNWEEDNGSRLELHGDGTFIWYRDANNLSLDNETAGWYNGNYWLMTGQEAIDFATSQMGLDNQPIQEMLSGTDELTSNDFIAMRLFRDTGFFDGEGLHWEENTSISDYTGFMTADNEIFLMNTTTGTYYTFTLAE